MSTIGIKKIIVSDDVDENNNDIYIIEVEYYVETEKDELGMPALDLSKRTNLFSFFKDASANTIFSRELSYPTFVEGKLNPAIRETREGFRYPFYAKFNISAIDSPSFTLKLGLFLISRSSKKKGEAEVVLFSGGDLQIKNEQNIAIEDQRTNFYDNIFNIKIFAAGSSNNNSYLSELYVSYSKQNSVRGMFIFDKQRFLIDNSDFGYLLDNPKLPVGERRRMLGQSNIAHIEITRRMLSYLKDFNNNPYRAYKNQVPKTIATATIVEGILAATKEGTISQLSSLDLGGMEYEDIIAFNDTDLLDIGTHQYTLNMRVQDGILKWLVATTDRLIKIENEVNKKTSAPFLTRAIFALNKGLNISQKDLTSYLNNMIRHEGSLTILQSYITNLVATLSRVIGNAGVTSQVNTSYSKVYSNNNLDRFFLNLEKRFDETVDFKEAINLTYDYMGFPSNNDIGATTIDKETMELRFDREFNKLLKEKPESNYANLSRLIFADVFGYSDASDDTLRLAYFNFGPNYYAFLSPVRVGDMKLSPTNTFNYDLMTDEHLKKSYDTQLAPRLSVSYYLQERGISLGTQFFREDPPLQDTKTGQTYFPANDVFSSSDGVATAPAGSSTTYTAGIDLEPETNASRLFSSTLLRNEENWDLSKEDFNLTNETNLISSLDTAFERGTRATTTTTRPTSDISPQLKAVREMPNQIRAIFASKSDKCINQWLSPSMQGDYIYSPSTYYTIKQNYMNLLKIEYLSGFQKNANGLPDVKNPIFKKLTSLDGSGKILCRASIYNDQRFKIGVAFDEISYADKYFILDLTETVFGGIVAPEPASTTETILTSETVLGGIATTEGI